MKHRHPYIIANVKNIKTSKIANAPRPRFNMMLSAHVASPSSALSSDTSSQPSRSRVHTSCSSKSPRHTAPVRCSSKSPRYRGRCEIRAASAGRTGTCLRFPSCSFRPLYQRGPGITSPPPSLSTTCSRAPPPCPQRTSLCLTHTSIHTHTHTHTHTSPVSHPGTMLRSPKMASLPVLFSSLFSPHYHSFVFTDTRLSICPSKYLSVCLSMYPSVCFAVSVCVRHLSFCVFGG